jgi:hypothetical protein
VSLKIKGEYAAFAGKVTCLFVGYLLVCIQGRVLAGYIGWLIAVCSCMQADRLNEYGQATSLHFKRVLLLHFSSLSPSTSNSAPQAPSHI